VNARALAVAAMVAAVLAIVFGVVALASG